MNSNKNVIVHFNKVARSYRSNYEGNNIVSHSFNTRLKIVKTFIGYPKGKKILDIGCGPGLLAKELVDISVEFMGIDISERMIKECQQDKTLNKFKFQAIDPVEFLKENQSEKYHIIVCMGLFEYLTDKYTHDLMEKIAQHLYPGGILIGTYPNINSPYRKVDRIYQKLMGRDVMVPPYTPGVGHKEFSERRLNKEWKQYNIELNKVAYYNFRLIPKPLDNYLKGLDLLIARKLQVLSESPFRFLATAMVLGGKKCSK